MRGSMRSVVLSLRWAAQNHFLIGETEIQWPWVEKKRDRGIKPSGYKNLQPKERTGLKPGRYKTNYETVRKNCTMIIGRRRRRWTLAIGVGCWRRRLGLGRNSRCGCGRLVYLCRAG